MATEKKQQETKTTEANSASAAGDNLMALSMPSQIIISV